MVLPRRSRSGAFTGVNHTIRQWRRPGPIGGEAAPEIVWLAQEIRCAFIVMGTRGETGVTRLLMGSVAEQVVRSAAPCPVVTLKKSSAESIVATGGQSKNERLGFHPHDHSNYPPPNGFFRAVRGGVPGGLLAGQGPRGRGDRRPRCRSQSQFRPAWRSAPPPTVGHRGGLEAKTSSLSNVGPRSAGEGSC